MGESYSLAVVWDHFFGQRALVKADALSLFERGELNGVVVGITKKQYGHLHNVIFRIEC